MTFWGSFSAAFASANEPVDKPVYKLSGNCWQLGFFQKTKNYPESIHRQASGLPSTKFCLQVNDLKQYYLFIHRVVAELFSVVGLHIVIIKKPYTPFCT
jgi:hypothetical protein